MIIQTSPFQIPVKSQVGGNQQGLPSGFVNELLISELAPPYYSLTKAGVVYLGFIAGTNPAAYVGASGGTPIIGLYNPAGSGKDLIILQTRIAIRTTGSAAVAYDINWWMGTSVLPTGTRTNPTNMYSQQNAGSSAAMFVNTAMTGASTLANIIPVMSGGLTAATAVTNVAQAQDDAKGALIVAPGNLAALGQSAALTAAVVDVAVIWAELAA